MSYAAFRNLKINILLLMLQSGYYWMFLMDYYMDRLFVFIVVGVSVGLIVAHGNFKFQLQNFFSIFLTNCYDNQYFSWIEIQLVDILKHLRFSCFSGRSPLSSGLFKILMITYLIVITVISMVSLLRKKSQ